jgi:hypothetical protein
MAKRKADTSAMVDMSELFEDPSNANARDDIESIKDSLRDFGQDQDIVAQMGTGRIIKGNHRFKAMQSLGWVQCQVYWVADDDLKATRRGLADNRTGETRHWKDDVLDSLLDEVGWDTPGFDENYSDDLKGRLIPDDIDAQQKKLGNPKDSDFWPIIRISVPPDVHRRWKEICDARDSDYEAMVFLLEHV